MIGYCLIQVIPNVPAKNEIDLALLYQLPFGAESLQKHNQLRLEENHRINQDTSMGDIKTSHQFTHKAQIEFGSKVTIKNDLWEPINPSIGSDEI